MLTIPGIAEIKSYDNVVLSTEKILSWFEACEAVWLHDGDPKKPHAELTSGKCSNGFFDCLRVLRHPNVCEILARQLARKLKSLKLERIDGVIGSPYAAITFSHEVAKALGVVHWFAEKDPEDPKGKEMIWRRNVIPEGSRILQVEELITTSSTFVNVREAVIKGNPHPVIFLPYVGTLVYRPSDISGGYEGTDKIISLIEREIWAVDQEECPLCAKGSKRVRPKTHWKELTGRE